LHKAGDGRYIKTKYENCPKCQIFCVLWAILFKDWANKIKKRSKMKRKVFFLEITDILGRTKSKLVYAQS